MKKIKIFLLIFLILSQFYYKSFAEQEIINNSGTVTIDENNDKSLTDFILKRKEKIEEILKNGNNSIENEYNNISDDINNNKRNGEISNEIRKELQGQFESLNKAIIDKNKEIEELNAKDSEKVKKEISNLEKQKSELEKKINFEKDKILALEIEISELEVYKMKYEKLVNEDRKENLREKEKNLIIYFGIFLAYIIISGFGFRIKNSQKKSIFNVVSTAIFIISIVIFTLAINPGFMIIFIIIAGSIVLAFKDFIVSFIASILILRKYKIGDLIEIEGKKGKINSVSALNTTLLTDTGEIFLLNNFIILKYYFDFGKIFSDFIPFFVVVKKYLFLYFRDK
ncbi:hypothetical protein DLH72_01445 [Candidatus Gracilibacteria bacterium]|nr:MAG: hypothetical protein DLH72_01445 [Candidatus Gracilibacteria bacterium]